MSREVTVPTPTARLHEVTMAALHRAPAPPESSVTMTRNARGVVQFEVTVRHESAATAEAVCKELFAGLASEFPYPVENGGKE